MRTSSIVLAITLVLVGPSLAGPQDGGLPGVGTFAYNGSPIANFVVVSDGASRRYR